MVSLPKNPRFLVVEGIDGSGKSTLVEDIYKHIVNTHHQYVPTIVQEPGFTTVGKTIRSLLKEGKASQRALHLLVEGARIDLLEKVQEYLNHKYVADKNLSSLVLMDRHKDSTYAYQGNLGVSKVLIETIQDAYPDLPRPDLTIFLEVPPSIAKGRLEQRCVSKGIDLDVLDSLSEDQFADIRLNYWEKIHKNRSKYFVVDAARSREEVRGEVLALIDKMFT